jgi:hypothetical protein
MRFVLLLLALSGCTVGGRYVNGPNAPDSVKVSAMFSRDGCTVYKWTDSFGDHYLAAGNAVNGGGMVACAVTGAR